MWKGSSVKDGPILDVGRRPWTLDEVGLGASQCGDQDQGPNVGQDR